MGIGRELEDYRKLFKYDPNSGQLLKIGKVNPHTGNIDPITPRLVGTPHSTGRLYVHTPHGTIAAHRLAWWLYTGYEVDYIDHTNNNQHDNRWGNLRECTNQQNQYNKPLTRANRSGYKGVSWCKERRLWTARIKLPSGKYKYLGRFSNIMEAAIAYDTAATKVHGEFKNADATVQ